LGAQENLMATEINHPGYPKTTYEVFMAEQEIPIVEGWGVYDVTEVDRKPWKRMGGLGTFIQLHGQEHITALYVIEIPPHSALNVEKHLYEETFRILEGSGSTEVWAPDGRSQQFGWQKGAFFGIPMNAPHRLVNDSGSAVLALAMTNAPILMDHYHNPRFTFECDFEFDDRYNGEADYFQASESYPVGGRRNFWDTNFIPDLRTAAFYKPYVGEGSNVQAMGYEIAGSVMAGHFAEYPTGQYITAHSHGGGAVLDILAGEGYVLMWPAEATIRPYESGNEDKVIRFDFKENSVYGPGSGWFHMHLSTGKDNMRQLAQRFNSTRHQMGFWRHFAKEAGVLTDIRQGGTMITRADEDPRIRADFKAELAARGVPFAMLDGK